MVHILILSAIAPSDYMSLQEQKTFRPTVSRVCVNITLVGDDSNEDSETFSVKLTTSDGAVVLGRNVTTVIIGM